MNLIDYLLIYSILILYNKSSVFVGVIYGIERQSKKADRTRRGFKS